MQLLRSGGPIATIFDLLGSKEDDMTYSLGYVASRSTNFMDTLVSLVAGQTIVVDHAVVRLQTTSADQRGRTDVEVQIGQDFFCIFEAKRGPWLPDEPQLRRYVPILLSQRANIKRLVAVTNAPNEYAQLALPRELDSIPVLHVSWRTIKHLAEHARAGETNRNKQLLDEFATYLKGILGMEMAQSNLVYVVSLGDGGSWSVDYREVVQRQRRYFYPLEGIHHVDSFDVFTNPRTLFAEAEDIAVKPHYCLRLGPPIRPAKEVPNGSKIRMAMRVWCAIDALLTSDTITDAMVETKRRLGNEAPPEDPLEAAIT